MFTYTGYKSPQFCLSKFKSISPLLLEDNFAGYVILGWCFGFLPPTGNISIHGLLARGVFVTVVLVLAPLLIRCVCFPPYFKVSPHLLLSAAVPKCLR